MKRLLFLLFLVTVALGGPVAGAATDVLVDGFEGAPWNANWNGDWIRSGDQVHSGSSSAKANGSNDGMFVSRDINASGAAAINVDFWFRKDDTDAGNDFLLYYYDGATYTLIADLDALGGDDTWLHYTQTITDPRYFVANFRVQFEARNLSTLLTSRIENVWVDDLRISVGSGDLTCQEYTATNEQHVAANRAYAQTTTSGCERITTYYAVGSAENLGTSPSTSLTLYTTDGGQVYRFGSCPQNDADGDGVVAPADCDDADPTIHPGAAETCGDTIDQDCDGADLPCSADLDGDGHAAPADCDDADAAIHPGAAETCGDTIDQDCDGADLPCSADLDGDGHAAPADCNDTDAAIHPGAVETCGDTIDQDCDGVDLPCTNDNDGDGYGTPADCNDNAPAIYPGAAEICDDGIDQDCNGSDLACAPPAPSCILNLGNWKIDYKPKNSNCRSCHTTCTPGGGRHGCTEGQAWGSLQCTSCHTGNVH